MNSFSRYLAWSSIGLDWSFFLMKLKLIIVFLEYEYPQYDAS